VKAGGGYFEQLRATLKMFITEVFLSSGDIDTLFTVTSCQEFMHF